MFNGRLLFVPKSGKNIGIKHTEFAISHLNSAASREIIEASPESSARDTYELGEIFLRNGRFLQSLGKLQQAPADASPNRERQSFQLAI